jgi:molecular chaperone GrpE
MDPNQEIENIGELADDAETEESVSVDDFIKQLEAREKDLHITATTTIEIAQSFDDANLPDFLREDLQIEASKQVAATTAAGPKTKAVKASTGTLEKEVADLKEEITRIKTERDELFQASQRRTKDFENLKSRTERERKDTFQNQVGNLATQMLPALDNLNRAVDFALAMPEEERTEIQPFLDGVVLVNQQVNDVLAEMGVQPIATVGETFDPHFHEAVATEESGEFEANTISAELLRGYRIGERVIRHSMVKVVKASPFDEAEPVDKFDTDDEQTLQPSHVPSPDDEE